MGAEKLVRYTNQQTGEVHEKKSYVDVIFDYEKGYLFGNKKSKVITFLDKPLPREFTWAEKGKINELKHYMLKENQLLAYRSNKIIKPIGINQICKILESTERQVKELLKKMKQHGIIKDVIVDDLSYIAMNPVYFLRSKRITLTTYMWFQEELKDILPGWVKHNFLEQVSEIKTPENDDFKIIE